MTMLVPSYLAYRRNKVVSRQLEDTVTDFRSQTELISARISKEMTATRLWLKTISHHSGYAFKDDKVEDSPLNPCMKDLINGDTLPGSLEGKPRKQAWASNGKKMSKGDPAAETKSGKHVETPGGEGEKSGYIHQLRLQRSKSDVGVYPVVVPVALPVYLVQARRDKALQDAKKPQRNHHRLTHMPRSRTEAAIQLPDTARAAADRKARSQRCILDQLKLQDLDGKGVIRVKLKSVKTTAQLQKKGGDSVPHMARQPFLMSKANGSVAPLPNCGSGGEKHPQPTTANKALPSYVSQSSKPSTDNALIPLYRHTKTSCHNYKTTEQRHKQSKTYNHLEQSPNESPSNPQTNDTHCNPNKAYQRQSGRRSLRILMPRASNDEPVDCDDGQMCNGKPLLKPQTKPQTKPHEKMPTQTDSAGAGTEQSAKTRKVTVVIRRKISNPEAPKEANLAENVHKVSTTATSCEMHHNEKRNMNTERHTSLKSSLSQSAERLPIAQTWKTKSPSEPLEKLPILKLKSDITENGPPVKQLDKRTLGLEVKGEPVKVDEWCNPFPLGASNESGDVVDAIDEVEKANTNPNPKTMSGNHNKQDNTENEESKENPTRRYSIFLNAWHNLPSSTDSSKRIIGRQVSRPRFMLANKFKRAVNASIMTQRFQLPKKGNNQKEAQDSAEMEEFRQSGPVVKYIRAVSAGKPIPYEADDAGDTRMSASSLRRARKSLTSQKLLDEQVPPSPKTTVDKELETKIKLFLSNS